jgi:hypothetical protein
LAVTADKNTDIPVYFTGVLPELFIMKIASSDITLASQQQFEHSENHIRVVQERFDPRPRTSADRLQAPAVTVELSAQVQQTAVAAIAIETTAPTDLANMDMETNLLKLLVEAMTGKKIHSTPIEPVTASDEPIATDSPTTEATSAIDNEDIETTVFTLSEISEYQYSKVNISGRLSTDDGSTLVIDLQFEMERSYQQSSAELTIQRGRLTDPLVINFNGASARLSDQLTEFDLDSDGFAELLPSLVSDSAYLALDKNGDGIINNGSELFGPSSGNGFAELAQYDEDGNGFIDADDSIYAKLQAFRPSDNSLQSLQNLEIGVLYTGAVDSPFRLTDQHNQTLGQIRATGFYLNLDKSAGSLQQVDLVV